MTIDLELYFASVYLLNLTFFLTPE